MRRAACLVALAVLTAVAGALAADDARAAPGSRAYAAQRLVFLRAAAEGISGATRWWNPTLGWYDDRLDNHWNRRMPLARLWTVFPLFEALDARAIARPTRANIGAVRTFAVCARRYFNPLLAPDGGFSYYPGIRNARVHAYFDDNGWFAIAFLDAYRATDDRIDLVDAEKAVSYVDDAGWDVDGGGGTWWETLHLHKTSEPLAAVAYVAASLYRITHDRSYLALASRYVAWADDNLWDPVDGVYGRDSIDPTPMDYVEGMMIGAHLELCRSGRTASCRRAERLAATSVRIFRTVWAPTQDAVYLRFLLALYRYDHDSRWYHVAYEAGLRALDANGGAPGGPYLRRWNGRYDKLDLLQTHAGTTSLFAWLALAPPPTT